MSCSLEEERKLPLKRNREANNPVNSLPNSPVVIGSIHTYIHTPTHAYPSILNQIYLHQQGNEI